MKFIILLLSIGISASMIYLWMETRRRLLTESELAKLISEQINKSNSLEEQVIRLNKCVSFLYGESQKTRLRIKKIKLIDKVTNQL